MRRHILNRDGERTTSLISAVVVLGLLAISGVCRAADGYGEAVPPTPRATIRSGGVLEESYTYHRQPQSYAQARTVEPAGGWYGYGFPVRTVRWGWFGAEHYYPTVWWHEGYYGDCCRYAYRCGY
jgi:hypothetical protein